MSISFMTVRALIAIGSTASVDAWLECDNDGTHRRILCQRLKGGEQAFVDILTNGVYRRVVYNNDSDIRGFGWPLDLHDVVHVSRSLP